MTSNACYLQLANIFESLSCILVKNRHTIHLFELFHLTPLYLKVASNIVNCYWPFKGNAIFLLLVVNTGLNCQQH